MQEEKPASNFELNVIKLGIHTLQLHKGDRFESNGAYFHYVPSTPENKGKGTYYRFQGRKDNISAKKYEKDVMRADNIKLIRDDYQYTDSQGKEHRMKVWEVQYAYKIEQEKKEELFMLLIKLDQKRFDEPEQWIYEQHPLSIKRETDKLLFLKDRLPVTYHEKIDKTDLNNVHQHWGVYYILTYMDDKYQDNEVKLFNFVQKAKENAIQNAEAIIKKETENLNKFQTFKQQYGY